MEQIIIWMYSMYIVNILQLDSDLISFLKETTSSAQQVVENGDNKV